MLAFCFNIYILYHMYMMYYIWSSHVSHPCPQHSLYDIIASSEHYHIMFSAIYQFDIWHFIPNIFWPIWSWAKKVHILNYSSSFLWNAMLANSNDEMKWMHVGGISGKHSNSLNLQNSTKKIEKKAGSVDKCHFPNNSDLPCRENLIRKGKLGLLSSLASILK